MTDETHHSAPATPGEATGGADIQRQLSILLVDDEADSLYIMAAILESRGFDVVAVESGAEALQHVRENVPDVILLDVMMPLMSGLEVLAHLRRNPATAQTPVILVTAKRQDKDLISGYQQGADYYITKPCTADQLTYGLGLVLSGR